MKELMKELNYLIDKVDKAGYDISKNIIIDYNEEKDIYIVEIFDETESGSTLEEALKKQIKSIIKFCKEEGILSEIY